MILLKMILPFQALQNHGQQNHFCRAFPYYTPPAFFSPVLNDSAVNDFAMSGIAEPWTAEPFLQSLSILHSVGMPSSSPE
jgi:hypothetical protein